MKRFFALLLALVMCLSLAACGGKDNDKTPSGNSDTPPSSSQQQEQQEQQPEQSGTKEKEWPQNKLTDLIPAPTDVAISNLREDDTDTLYIYTVSLKDWTLEAAEAYVEQVKEAGFDVDVNADFSFDSIRGKYWYEAHNSDGVTCSVIFNPEKNSGEIQMMEKK